MKGPIPDLSKPSPIRAWLRERREKSIAEGNALVQERDLLNSAWARVEEKWNELKEYAEIERQMG